MLYEVITAPEEMYPMKEMKNFTFQNIIADNTELDKNSAFFLTGMPGHYIENVIIKDVQFFISGGGTKEDAEKKDHNEYTRITSYNVCYTKLLRLTQCYSRDHKQCHSDEQPFPHLHRPPAQTMTQ